MIVSKKNEGHSIKTVPSINKQNKELKKFKLKGVLRKVLKDKKLSSVMGGLINVL